jgi:hypothetical protein
MNEPHDSESLHHLFEVNATIYRAWLSAARRIFEMNITDSIMLVPNISTWAGSVQAAVTAIRNAGATSQLILLPGTE